MMKSLAVTVFLLLCTGTAAFSSSQRTAFRTNSMLKTAPRRRSTELKMFDGNTLIGIAAGAAGLGFGAGFVWFTEKATIRAEERGSDVVSESTKNKLAAQFMEDVEQSADLDDVVTKMEKAMAAAQGVKVEELESVKKERTVLDDGW
eukprot:CAMPEP_0185744018 /NCGR_PEP_ID=MMETSP1174-20130828/1978_1 /TAXON_ID=35687 /ORGANISM="Dictyocha speculum, Strain CCMP1381" /LENGTH=146 /DNA_ID=CAMNT_0028417123 /DNA_START=23 /DNA_END=463 /DNA_ORIENTATION=-